MLNPEMIQLAFFIDVVGFEMFVMLLEFQILAFLGVLFNAEIKPKISYIINLFTRHFLMNSWKNIKEKPEILILAVPGQAVLMYMLVFLVAISIVFNAF